jgi:hypothetical protein
MQSNLCVWQPTPSIERTVEEPTRLMAKPPLVAGRSCSRRSAAKDDDSANRKSH